jgi:hypothetical protein
MNLATWLIAAALTVSGWGLAAFLFWKLKRLEQVALESALSIARTMQDARVAAEADAAAASDSALFRVLKRAHGGEE